MKDYLSAAIKKLHPEAEFSFSDNDYSTIKWDVLEGKAPTQKQIDDTIEIIKAEEIAEAQAKEAQRQAILDRIGLTADEAKLLLG
jgi:hypothetical protein